MGLYKNKERYMAKILLSRITIIIILLCSLTYSSDHIGGDERIKLGRQINPFLNQTELHLIEDQYLTEEQIKQKNIINSNEYKKFTQNFDKRIYISIDEQKGIIEKIKFLQLENLDDWKAYLELGTKEQQVLYDYYLMKNSIIPSNYLETLFDEKEYKIKEETIWEMFQGLDIPISENICLSHNNSFYNLVMGKLSYDRLPKYRDQLLTILSILYVVKTPRYEKLENIVNPFTYYQKKYIKYGYLPILVCSDRGVDVHYGNFMDIYVHENIELEQKYREIFLLMMQEEMLKNSKYIFVPLSMMREHAEQSDISDYISKEIIKKPEITHHELAIQYYGSLDAWMMDVFNFIKNKYLQ